MGNIGPVSRSYDVLPLGVTTIADLTMTSPAFDPIVEPSAYERATEPSPSVPAPEPMPAPYPDPTPEPSPIPSPPSPPSTAAPMLARTAR